VVQVAAVPALCGLLLTPMLLYKLFPPQLKDTPEAPKVGRWRSV
jgi:DASS family divalent anion:Na+ symporter